LTAKEDRQRRRIALYPRTHGLAPDCYRAIAELCLIEAEESRNPGVHLAVADNQRRLADDIEARPKHYKMKPPWKTDWQWSGLSLTPAIDVEKS
jgi:hypothetical protein